MAQVRNNQRSSSLDYPMTIHKNFHQILEKIKDSFFSYEHIFKEMDSETRAEVLDRIFHANLGQVSTGLSPAALTVAYTDWFAHLAISPNKQLQLFESACKKYTDLWNRNADYFQKHTTSCFELEDKRFHERFQHAAWQKWPYCSFAQFFLQAEEWWQEATDLRGLEKNHRELVSFIHFQWLNALSPENSLFFNPEVQQKIIETKGQNLIIGWKNWQEDVKRYLNGERSVGAEEFVVGEDVAITPGKVVFRNHLFELIQYKPQTKEVYPEPLLIIPAWIMKYYILDLSSDNSMVDYLVKQGHTVFMVSWKNPDASYRNFGMSDYLKKGAVKAINTVKEITGQKKIHSVGYCIGGTTLAMTAAYLARHGKEDLKTMTLFAAQTDFEEAGELMTFIDENQLCYLEDIMFTQGFLRGDQMSSTFNLLRPKELIWSRAVERYLLGERPEMIDLLAWNEDTTRLPYKMHSDYLRHFHLHNDLAEGDYKVDGKPVTLGDINVPIFSVATEKDHIAPWKSAYKINFYAYNADITFVLANKGHNGGIISEPGHQGRHYRIGKKTSKAKYIAPDEWFEKHKIHKGSWWQAWHQWLAEQSSAKTKPPTMGAPAKDMEPMEDAPGTYVKEK